jgi:pimeloyl-ACP methyl ester carboxylesterase
MTETTGQLLRLGEQFIVWRRVTGRGPCLVWLGGFGSDMTGSKAQALADWAASEGRDFLRFDYFGHGASSGDFKHGTISLWRDDALAVLDELTSGPVILIGSSMGGWLGCLAALARPERVASLVLIAPAADFTDKLMQPSLGPEALLAIEQAGFWLRPSDYGDEGYPITKALLDDGRQWSILPGPVQIACPVRILQGGQDPDVPWDHALSLAQALDGPDVVFTLIRDGDHRLSRPQDIKRLIAVVSETLDVAL